MNQQFCGNCGAKVEEGTAFCPSCGSRIAALESQPTAQPAVQPAVQPVANTPRKQLNMKAILTMAGGVVVVALVIVLIVLLSGDGPAGEVLKNYRYKEIVGEYLGELTMQKVKVGGDYDEIAEFTGMMSESDMKDLKDEILDCALYLTDDTLTIETDEAAFFQSSRITISELEFVKGHAEGKLTEEDDNGSKVSITYDLTLHEGTKRDTKYRIYGEVQVSFTLKILKAKCTCSCTVLVDCEQ